MFYCPIFDSGTPFENFISCLKYVNENNDWDRIVWAYDYSGCEFLITYSPTGHVNSSFNICFEINFNGIKKDFPSELSVESLTKVFNSMIVESIYKS